MSLFTTAAEAVISKGFGDKPAIQYFDGEKPYMRFRIGVRTYDNTVEGNYRWINMMVKAFGAICERAMKMNLKEGSYVTVIGRQDEETWVDDKTGKKHSRPVIIAELIDYSSGGNGKMFTVATDVVISQGYGDKAAIKFIDRETKSMRFRIGVRVYDNRVEGNYRWLNISVKAFGELCERAKKMKLKAGSFITIVGRQVEEFFIDEKSGEEFSKPVIIAEIIEYSGGNGKANKNIGAQIDTTAHSECIPGQLIEESSKSEKSLPHMPENFTGYQSFMLGKSENPFFPI